MRYSLTDHHPVSFWVLCTALVLAAEASFVYLAMQPKVSTYQQPGLSLQADTKTENSQTQTETVTQKILPSAVYKNTQKAEPQTTINPLPANCFTVDYCIPVSQESSTPGNGNEAIPPAATPSTNESSGTTISIPAVQTPVIPVPSADISL